MLYLKKSYFNLSSSLSNHSTLSYKAALSGNTRKLHSVITNKSKAHILTFIKVHVRNGFALESSTGRPLGHQAVLNGINWFTGAGGMWCSGCVKSDWLVVLSLLLVHTEHVVPHHRPQLWSTPSAEGKPHIHCRIWESREMWQTVVSCVNNYYKYTNKQKGTLWLGTMVEESI